MKPIKRLNSATIYVERNPGSNAKFYVKIDQVLLDTVFDSEQDAVDFCQDWTGSDDSTTVEQDIRVVDSGFVEVFKLNND